MIGQMAIAIHVASIGFNDLGRSVTTGLSLRAGGRRFSPATTSLSPGYFDTKRKYLKEKNASNYKVMN